MPWKPAQPLKTEQPFGGTTYASRDQAEAEPRATLARRAPGPRPQRDARSRLSPVSGSEHCNGAGWRRVAGRSGSGLAREHHAGSAERPSDGAPLLVPKELVQA
ncbi:hypothetical protein Are01nite_36300 [Actinoplanes regularis]|nr:hypothetical protein Are01nite_36300 [Actinoplanes regularis]